MRVCVPSLPPAEKGAYTLNRAGKSTRRLERVFNVSGALRMLDCGAGCVDCFGGAHVVTVWMSSSAMT